ncbi:MAG: L,D-transpeptidase [Pseudomonadota bacterium]
MPELIDISIKNQVLEYRGKSGEVLACYPISSGLNGVGEQEGSYQTPRGLHKIRAKIGAGLPENAILVARRFTGELYTPELHKLYPGKDWILTRILWLSGCEIGKNRLGSCDTMRRYIYLHGTPDSTPLGGEPASKGCIRMRNRDIIELFDAVPVYTPVVIRED